MDRATLSGSRGNGCVLTLVLAVGGLLGVLFVAVGLLPFLVFLTDGSLFGSDGPAVDPPPPAALRDPTCDDVYYEQQGAGAVPYWQPFPSVTEVQAALDTPREHRDTTTLLTCRLGGVRSDDVSVVVVARWVEDSSGRQRVVYREAGVHGAGEVATIPVAWHRH